MDFTVLIFLEKPSDQVKILLVFSLFFIYIFKGEILKKFYFFAVMYNSCTQTE